MEWVAEAAARARAVFERGGATASEAEAAARTLIPPTPEGEWQRALDGAENFERGIGAWTLCAWLVESSGAVSQSSVISPMTAERYTARRGGGAHLNGARIKPSTCATFHRSLVALEVAQQDRAAPDDEAVDAFMQTVSRLLATPPAYRTAGVISWDLCLVAAGALDGCYVAGFHEPEPLTAAVLIVMAAGGRVAFRDGGPLVAANPLLFPALARAAGLRVAADFGAGEDPPS